MLSIALSISLSLSLSSTRLLPPLFCACVCVPFFRFTHSFATHTNRHTRHTLHPVHVDNRTHSDHTHKHTHRSLDIAHLLFCLSFGTSLSCALTMRNSRTPFPLLLFVTFFAYNTHYEPKQLQLISPSRSCTAASSCFVFQSLPFSHFLHFHTCILFRFLFRFPRIFRAPFIFAFLVLHRHFARIQCSFKLAFYLFSANLFVRQTFRSTQNKSTYITRTHLHFLISCRDLFGFPLLAVFWRSPPDFFFFWFTRFTRSSRCVCPTLLYSLPLHFDSSHTYNALVLSKYSLSLSLFLSMFICFSFSLSLSLSLSDSFSLSQCYSHTAHTLHVSFVWSKHSSRP